jgi:hypothetical protein
LWEGIAGPSSDAVLRRPSTQIGEELGAQRHGSARQRRRQLSPTVVTCHAADVDMAHATVTISKQVDRRSKGREGTSAAHLERAASPRCATIQRFTAG